MEREGHKMFFYGLEGLSFEMRKLKNKSLIHSFLIINDIVKIGSFF